MPCEAGRQENSRANTIEKRPISGPLIEGPEHVTSKSHCLSRPCDRRLLYDPTPHAFPPERLSQVPHSRGRRRTRVRRCGAVSLVYGWRCCARGTQRSHLVADSTHPAVWLRQFLAANTSLGRASRSPSQSAHKSACRDRPYRWSRGHHPPARGGDVVKLALASRIPHISVAQLAAAELIERCVDGVVLGTFITSSAVATGAHNWLLLLGLLAIAIHGPVFAALPLAGRVKYDVTTPVSGSYIRRLLSQAIEAVRETDRPRIIRAIKLSVMAWGLRRWLATVCLSPLAGLLHPRCLLRR